MTTDTVPVQGKYQRAVRAPRGLRRVMKLGEIDRAISAVDEWRELEARVEAARRSLVEDVRSRGGSWDSIGWLLGVTGDAVRQRYGGGADSHE